ncbi:hypothetical protein MATL_G00136460 [Megalops atlanticus]|uniref:Transposase domain-containing protein n=1 Tax=Megalops atlanticus TaxID=7932 RepID=A0A9D3PWH0_MEGAT|nr:hypothetical protein MATL_G00136460 [Megalops atlanticus]
MAESNKILSKRSLRRHVKNTEAVVATLQSINRNTYNTFVEDSNTAVLLMEVDSCDSDAGGDWFRATSGQEDMSATSGQEENTKSDYYSSDEQDEDSDIDDSNTDNLCDDLRAWAAATNTPLSHLSSLLTVLRKHLPNANLPKDGRTLLSTPTSTEVQSKAGGSMHYFGVANGIKSRIEDSPTLKSIHTLRLQINVDGMPLFKSSNEQFWPILALIEEDPNRIPFVVALYSGQSKPSDANEYLSDFVMEMERIASDGVVYQSKLYKVEISAFVCDAPARAFIKNIKSHNSYYGCERCAQEGVWSNNRMNYPETNAASRTDESFKAQLHSDHHRDGESALIRINIGMVSQFVLDFMHLVCLGVMRKLRLWMRGPLPSRIGNQSMTAVSDKLVLLGKKLPKEFGRKGRSLREVDRWKATEFRTFLLYTGPIALKNTLPDAMYNHFLLLHVGITILCSTHLSEHYCDYAEKVLTVFVQNFSVIYGDFVVYNVHGLIHLANDVRKFGPLPKISAFPFENYLYQLKRKISKPNQPLQQIVKRLTEQPLNISSVSQSQHTNVLCAKPPSMHCPVL